MSKKKSSLPLVDLENAIKRANKSLRENSEEKAQKLLSKKVVERTGRKCHCGGNIVKVKSWVIRPRNWDGLIGPGSEGDCYRELEPEDLTEQFTPLHCENCGTQYFKLPKAGH